VYQRHDTIGPKAKNHFEQGQHKMAYRALLSDLEFEDDPEPGHGVHTILSSLWGQGRIAHKLRIWLPVAIGI
jgi:hypothetical protein